MERAVSLARMGLVDVMSAGREVDMADMSSMVWCSGKEEGRRSVWCGVAGVVGRQDGVRRVGRRVGC